MKRQYTYHHAPQETWSVAECEKARKYAPADHWGNRPPKGIIQGSADARPRYGRQRFNGGIIIDGEWYDGTDNPYPIVPDPYVLAWLTSWGMIITTKEDAEKRGLTLLRP
jgi:hypothetical protein